MTLTKNIFTLLICTGSLVYATHDGQAAAMQPISSTYRSGDNSGTLLFRENLPPNTLPGYCFQRQYINIEHIGVAPNNPNAAQRLPENTTLYLMNAQNNQPSEQKVPSDILFHRNNNLYFLHHMTGRWSTTLQPPSPQNPGYIYILHYFYLPVNRTYIPYTQQQPALQNNTFYRYKAGRLYQYDPRNNNVENPLLEGQANAVAPNNPSVAFTINHNIHWGTDAKDISYHLGYNTFVQHYYLPIIPETVENKNLLSAALNNKQNAPANLYSPIQTLELPFFLSHNFIPLYQRGLHTLKINEPSNRMNDAELHNRLGNYPVINLKFSYDRATNQQWIWVDYDINNEPNRKIYRITEQSSPLDEMSFANGPTELPFVNANRHTIGKYVNALLKDPWVVDNRQMTSTQRRLKNGYKAALDYNQSFQNGYKKDGIRKYINIEIDDANLNIERLRQLALRNYSYENDQLNPINRLKTMAEQNNRDAHRTLLRVYHQQNNQAALREWSIKALTKAIESKNNRNLGFMHNYYELAVERGTVFTLEGNTSFTLSNHQIDVYKKFIKGKIMFVCNGTFKEFLFADFASTLEGEFDLSGLTYTYDGKTYTVSDYLSINLGYRKAQNPAHRDKVEVWILPKFLMERDINSTASHYRPLMNKWTSDVGLLWTRGNWANNDGSCDHLINNQFDEINNKNLLHHHCRSGIQRSINIPHPTHDFYQHLFILF